MISNQRRETKSTWTIHHLADRGVRVRSVVLRHEADDETSNSAADDADEGIRCARHDIGTVHATDHEPASAQTTYEGFQ